MKLRYAGRVLAGAAVTLLLLGLGLRTFFNLAPDHLANIEPLISTALGRPVHIGALRVSWLGWRPQLAISELRLRDESNTRDLLKFDRAWLEVDLLESVLNLAPRVSVLDLHAREIRLVRDVFGGIAVEGFDPHSNVLAQWLLQQRRLRVQAENLVWTDATLTAVPQVVGQLQLLAEALSGQPHRLNLTLRQGAEQSGPLELGLEFTGDLLAGDWQGKTYCNFSNVERIWLSGLLPGAYLLPVAAERTSLEMWGDWAHGWPRSLTGHLSLVSEAARQPGIIRVAKRFAGQFSATPRSPDSWTIAIPQLELTESGQAWYVPEVTIQLDPGGTAPAIRLHATTVPAASVGPVLRFLAPNEGRDTWLSELQPTGWIRNLQYVYRDDPANLAPTHWGAEFEGLTLEPTSSSPGIRGASGSVNGTSNDFRGRLEISGGRVDYPKYFPRAMDVPRAVGDFAWKTEGAAWELTIPAFDFRTTDFAGRAEGTVSDLGNGLQTDLRVAVDRVDLVNVPAYVPLTVPARVRDWLNAAFKGGQATAITAQLRGPLAAFPFDGNEGQVTAEADLEGGRLTFLSSWPSLENIQGKFRYSGREIQITQATGTTLSAHLHGVETSISGLGTKTPALNLAGHAQAETPVALAYLFASPLRDLVPADAERLKTSGAAELDLTLKIPFGPPPSQVTGDVRLRNSSIALAEGKDNKSALQGLSGSISFSQTGLRKVSLQGKYQKAPVLVSLVPKTRQLRARITVDSRLLTQQLFASLLKVKDARAKQLTTHLFQGRTALDVSVDTDAAIRRAARTIHLSSTLQGLAINAPVPLGKTATDSLPLEVSLSQKPGGGVQGSVVYGVRGSSEFQRGPDGKLGQVAVFLGARDRATAISGSANVWIAGATEQLSITEWQKFLAILTDGSTSLPSLDMPRTAIDLQIEHFELGGYHLRTPRIRAFGDSHSRWRVELSGPDAQGTVRYFPGSNRLTGRFRQFTLRPSSVESVGEKISPASLPHIEVDCDDFWYDNLHLGKLEFSGDPENGGLRMQRLGFTSPAMKLRGVGVWSAGAEKDQSNLDIQVEAAELGKLLGQFGYSHTGFAEGKSAFNIIASWSGTPADFDLARLAGHLHLKIENGRLLSVDNRVGRIFGLLSIDAFWRRLTLDFRDIFKKGFAFDRIEGDFNVSNGVASTDNMVLVGPAARIDVRGITDLAAQSIEQKAIVSPAVASTLPVAGALFGPAGLGVGAALYLAEKAFPLLPRELDALMRSEYTIKGPWADPEVKKVSGF